MSAVIEASMPALATRSAMAERRLHVLTLTTLFPSAVSPRHGIFVETRLRKLRRIAPVDHRVVAPVPWFPVRWKMAGRYATYAATPRTEERDGVPVVHPRYVTIPKIGMSLQPAMLAASALRATRAVLADGWRCDVIDAHYLYPDGVAAAMVAERLGIPFVVTARGTDVNLIARMPGPRERILWSLGKAHRIIAVSEALKRALMELGVAGARIEVLRNGVDTDLFTPRDGASRRQSLGVGPGPLIATVGNLVPGKGHDIVLRAAARLRDASVVVVGRGPERRALQALAQSLGAQDRVKFLDEVSQADLAQLYSAADVLALASWREGWPNVLLEAMACGTPVVATDVGGVREIVGQGFGEVVTEHKDDLFAAALERVLAQPPRRDDVRAYASGFSWEPIARRYHAVLADAAAQGHAR